VRRIIPLTTLGATIRVINQAGRADASPKSGGFGSAYARASLWAINDGRIVQVKTDRRTIRGLVAVALCAAGIGTARADTLQAHYAVSLVGLRIGDLYAHGKMGSPNYQIDLHANLTGLATLVSSARLALASSGAMRRDRLAPMTYATSSVNEAETRTLRMALKAGTVKAVEIMPAPQFYGERVPVTEANKRNVLDPTSALIMPVPRNEPLDGPAACDRTLPIYDGYARFDIALHYAGTQSVSVPGYSGPVAMCTARYHPISGHMVNSRSTAFMAQNTGIEVWLAPVEGAHVVVPFRVALPTMTGQLEVQAVEFTTGRDAAAR
jgi:hypothetical protein